jgi:hypothetical protein
VSCSEPLAAKALRAAGDSATVSSGEVFVPGVAGSLAAEGACDAGVAASCGRCCGALTGDASSEQLLPGSTVDAATLNGWPLAGVLLSPARKSKPDFRRYMYMCMRSMLRIYRNTSVWLPFRYALPAMRLLSTEIDIKVRKQYTSVCMCIREGSWDCICCIHHVLPHQRVQPGT